MNNISKEDLEKALTAMATECMDLGAIRERFGHAMDGYSRAGYAERRKAAVDATNAVIELVFPTAPRCARCNGELMSKAHACGRGCQ